MQIVGCTLVANAIRLDFPILEAIRSVLPLCDELLVNVGPSDDGTLDLIRSLDDPRIRVLEGEWDGRLGGRVLARETQRLLDAARGDWAIYIQADEVLDPRGQAPLRAALDAAHEDPAIEGLLVDFVHFYGSTDWIGASRSWYRREVRAVRLGADVRSVGDAQGFRVGPTLRRIRARPTGVTWYHYGWARPLATLRTKQATDDALLYGGAGRRTQFADRLPWDVGLTPFRDEHPALMHPWIAARRDRMSPDFAPLRWSRRRVSLMLTLAIERLTGWRPFEHRNYVIG